MRKSFLVFAAIVLTLHLVGCDGGGSVASSTETKRTPEQEKEIADMKANMLKGVKKGR